MHIRREGDVLNGNYTDSTGFPVYVLCTLYCSAGNKQVCGSLAAAMSRRHAAPSTGPSRRDSISALVTNKLHSPPLRPLVLLNPLVDFTEAMDGDSASWQSNPAGRGFGILARLNKATGNSLQTPPIPDSITKALPSIECPTYAPLLPYLYI